MRYPSSFTCAAVALLLVGCSEMQLASHVFKKAGLSSGNKKCVAIGQGENKIGNPYKIKGIRYTPLSKSTGYKEKGIASWYGADFHAKPTANGECYDMYAISAAHKTLPIPTWVRVTHMENGRSIVLRVNDRGPFARGRIIDLSYGAAAKLGMVKQGTAPVTVEAISGPFHDNPSSTRFAQKSSNQNQPKPKPTSRLTNRTQTQPSNVPAKPSSTFTQRVSQKPTMPAESQKEPHRLTAAKQEKAKPAVQQLPETLEEELPPPPEEHPQTSTEVLDKTQIYVQTGAFSTHSNATRQLDKAATFGQGHIMETTKDGRTLHRVRVGPFDTIAQADDTLTTMVNAGFNTAVLVIEKKAAIAPTQEPMNN